MLRALVRAALGLFFLTSALPLRAPARGSILSSCLKPWKGCPEGGSLSGSRLGENFAGFSEAMTMYDGSKSDKSASTSAPAGENGLDRAASKGLATSVAATMARLQLYQNHVSAELMLAAPDATKGGVDEEEGRASWWLFQFLAILLELVLGLFVFGRVIPRCSSAAKGAAWRSYGAAYLLISPEIALVAAAATSVRGSDYTIMKSSKIKTNESPSSSVQSLEQRRVLSGGSSDYAITKSSKIKTNESPSSSVQSLEQRRVLSGYVMTDSNIRTAVAAWLSDATSAEAMYGHISTWATGGVTDMSYLFCGASTDHSGNGYCNTAAASFNEDIGAWDTSGVTTMEGIFIEALSFNRDIGAWDTSGVISMYGVFGGALAFNQDIGDWAIDSVTTMFWMFYGASAFDQDLGWCADDDVDLYGAFNGTPCQSTSCGVVQVAECYDRSKFCLNPSQYNGGAPSNYPGYTCDGFLGAEAKMNAIDWSSDSAIQAACADPEVYDGNTRAGVMNYMAGGSNPCCADLKSACYSSDYDEDDDEDCTPGFWVLECRDDGTLMRGFPRVANGDGGCDSCDCEAVEDLTAATSGQYTCEPGTNTILYDEDLDGNADESWEFSECWYDDCSEDDDDEDDDCTPGYGVAECLDDGTFMHNDECDSCDCEMDDLTTNSGGQYTCDPGTNTFYIDEDLDGNVDHEGQFGDCWYDDCSEDEEDGDEDDDDDCTPGFEVIECREDGTVMQGFGCQSCDCATTHDLTADYGGRVTCEPGTNTWYYDEDLDGNVDDDGEFNECWYDDCSEDDDDDDGDDDGDDDDDDDECDIETSNDLNSSPSGTTNHGAGSGWCFSNLNNQIGCTASPADCWERCSDGYGDDLVAIDWWDDGSCDCQNDCECMHEVGGAPGYIFYTVTRDSAVAALPVECGPTATPTPAPISQATPSDGGGNGGADAASAGLIGGTVAGVAVIAAIAVGAYVYMRRAKDSADLAPMAEVEVLGTITGAVESGALKDAAPDPSAPPLMPPPPPEPAQERPSMVSRLASWRAPAAEAPTGRNFCSACGAPVQGQFCSACGARA